MVPEENATCTWKLWAGVGDSSLTPWMNGGRGKAAVISGADAKAMIQGQRLMNGEAL